MPPNKLLVKILDLLKERNWSIYRLAKEAKIPYSSLNSLFVNNTQPTVATIEKICNGFCITLSEFFSDETPYRNETPNVSEQEKEFLEVFRSLSKRDKIKYLEIINILNK